MKPELLPWHLYLSRSHPPRTALGNRSIESSGQVPVLSSHKLVFFLFFFFPKEKPGSKYPFADEASPPNNKEKAMQMPNQQSTPDN